MSIINLLKSDVWSEADITNAGREIIASQVSEARQNELRTIMLGHLAQLRPATQDELVEINLVQQLTVAQAAANDAARADMALLNDVMAYESALARLSLPAVTEPATVSVTDMQGHTTQVDNPKVLSDAYARVIGQAIVAAASAQTLALYDLRHPVVVVEAIDA